MHASTDSSDLGSQGLIKRSVCPRRLLDLQTFAAEAREAGAVVLNTLHAELGDNGFLQSYLEQKEVQVLHTGSDSQVTALCHDKVYTAKIWTTSYLPVESATGRFIC